MKNLFLICAVLFTTPVALADDITTETCANGAGTVIVGKSGTQYCMSNNTMNFWNAYSWCDSLGMRFIDLNTECGCSSLVDCNGPVNTAGKCPELATGVDTNIYIWTTYSQGQNPLLMSINNGEITSYWTYRSHTSNGVKGWPYHALCR